MQVTSGVPQGSPLSPLVFKLAFAPPDVPSPAKDFIFVDDYAVIVKATTCSDLKASAQSILDEFWAYGQADNLKFDKQKSCIMPITPESRISVSFGSNGLQKWIGTDT
jgi:hypothetical protein